MLKATLPYKGGIPFGHLNLQIYHHTLLPLSDRFTVRLTATFHYYPLVPCYYFGYPPPASDLLAIAKIPIFNGHCLDSGAFTLPAGFNGNARNLFFNFNSKKNFKNVKRLYPRFKKQGFSRLFFYKFYKCNKKIIRL